eukprot:Ihof_evm18s5 gene=Ihof_evmTU18s5
MARFNLLICTFSVLLLRNLSLGSSIKAAYVSQITVTFKNSTPHASVPFVEPDIFQGLFPLNGFVRDVTEPRRVLVANPVLGCGPIDFNKPFDESQPMSQTLHGLLGPLLVRGLNTQMDHLPEPNDNQFFIVALRGECSYEEKQNNAMAAGAAGLLIANTVDDLFVMQNPFRPANTPGAFILVGISLSGIMEIIAGVAQDKLPYITLKVTGTTNPESSGGRSVWLAAVGLGTSALVGLIALIAVLIFRKRRD